MIATTPPTTVPELEDSLSHSAPARTQFYQRYVPLIVVCMALLTLLIIPLKISSYGFVPAGDARRHVAKAFTDKVDSDVIVQRPGFALDHNPGWEWVLRHLQRTTGWNLEQLTVFAIATLLLALFVAPLPWLRRPEAWLAALLAELIVLPYLMVRLGQIRPLLIPEAVLVALLLGWSKEEPARPSWPKLILTCAGFCIATWIDGAWFLWAFLFAGFFLARAWRRLWWLVACWALGTAIALVLIGHPIEFMVQTLKQVATVTLEKVPAWVLVGEMGPTEALYDTFILIAIVFLWRRQQGKTTAALLDTPVFWMVMLCALLGLKTERCWGDWGIPAALVWLAMQFEEAFVKFCDAESPKRLILCGAIGAALFLQSTNDYGGRYSRSAAQQFIEAKNPDLDGWLPGKNGIFYCTEMNFYYDTFYKNPQADWRYILGYEPALMPEEDLKILRAIQLSHNAFSAYEPWIRKMTAADRLVIYCGFKPNLPQLEWHQAVGELWLGRLPETKSH